MNHEKIRVKLTHDLDGVANIGSTKRTFEKLRNGTFDLGDPNQEFVKKETSNKTFIKLIEQFLILYHWVRPIYPDFVKGLKILQDSQVGLADDLEISLLVLSGREPYLHAMTKAKLLKRLGDFFNETDIYLNEGYRSADWKELKVREFVGLGEYVLHVEDDLQAALQIARVSTQKVRVYLLRRRSNSPELLAMNQIVLPENVILVNSYLEAAHEMKDFVEKLWVAMGQNTI